VSLLELFGRPCTPDKAALGLPGYDPLAVQTATLRLHRQGLLLSVAEARRRIRRLASWKGNTASANYHMASRNIGFLRTTVERNAFLKTRLADERRPPFFKRYRGLPKLRLSRNDEGAPHAAAALDGVLHERRTVRRFRRRQVPIDELSAIVRGTWGQTGWLEGGVLRRAPTRTSPSGGAMHPTECYVLAWRVRGLAPGIYHYDVPDDAFVLLRRGDPRRAAVRAASGQAWIAGAAFLCVMTAVLERKLWKYPFENAYRSLWLDAGHLGQTFVLLATARGFGAFTTAAIQHSMLEELLGLDGVSEFPLYLCGAGVPDTRNRFPRWKPLAGVRPAD
jgi:SagB-type dehydrogenase family enzyme